MNVDEKQAFIALFRSVSRNDKALSKDDWEFVPQTLYVFADPAFRFFVEIAPGFSRPGFCGLRIHIFDDDWRFVRRDAFSTGYRQEITDVYKIKPNALATDVLVIKTTSAGPWEVTRDGRRIGTPFFAGKHQLQFYAVVDGSLMLVRREDEQGRLVLNGYANWSVPEIGMNYPKGTTPELLEILRSGSAPRRLALLAWIAGRHMSSGEKRVAGVSQEPLESSLAHEALTRSPVFAARVRVLRGNENEWIRDYAARIEIGEQVGSGERG
jgi:CRP-like cAMP-binding protein